MSTSIPGAALCVLLAAALSGCQDGGGASAPGMSVRSPGGDAAGDAGGGAGDGAVAGGAGAGGEVGGAAQGGEGEGEGGGEVGGAPGPVDERGYGEPCRSNAGCESGYCVSSPRGFVCTRACGSIDDCPDIGGHVMSCRDVDNTGADAVAVCVPAATAYCQPCFDDSHCFGGLCVGTGADVASFCGQDCGGQGRCPGGAVCSDLGPDGGALDPPQCLPLTLTCDCTEETAGDVRPCVRQASAGSSVSGARCFGEETCDPARGWVGCDAPTPDSEMCDGVDNDCNGAVDDGLEGARECEQASEFGVCRGMALCQGEEGWVCQAPRPAVEGCDLADNDCDGSVDEDFRDAAGLYVDEEHCGVCGNACDVRFDVAVAAECRADEGRARCVITECREGYGLVGPTVCIPLASRLCQACARDADCNLDVGDRCLDYPGGQGFCGRACDEGSPFGPACPPGYLCDADTAQCRLERGTCLCGPDDQFERSCAIPDPNEPGANCVGVVQCEAGLLSECTPPEDLCNGVDDDCDGVIDQGLRDPASGHWFTDAHCGRCHNNCRLLFADPVFHADGVCSGLEDAALGRRPRCQLACDEGWRDVNAVSADGCECEVLDAEGDEPDALGVDANCDGIDGVIARGVFVARTGDDGGAGTLEQPLRTISAAVERATPGVRDHVYVAAGVYEESVVLRAGVSIFGGYGADFQVRDIAGNETALFGVAPGVGSRGALHAEGIVGSRTVVAGFTIVGFDTREPSANSYAVYVVDSGQALELRNNVIRGGRGGAGAKGSTGQPGREGPDDARAGDPERAAAGGPDCRARAANRSAGGAGARHQCSDADGQAVDADGGDGGASDCPAYDQPEEAGADGDRAGVGVGAAGAGRGGAGGYSMLLTEDWAGQCYCTIPHAEGSTEDGVPGADGADGAPGLFGAGCVAGQGSVVGGQWVGAQGGGGRRGDPGGGGGGGGAGSGVERDNVLWNCAGFAEVIGGGGGGGGAGGCGGAGGGNGRSGGGSFAVFVTYTAAPASLPTIVDNRVERGVGGTGGDGGEGAEGGAGSVGKEAQTLANDERPGLLVCADPGGRGGDGGAGGAGGGGGGGCGGVSSGIYVAGHGPLPTAALRAANTFPGSGAGGLGGRGGVSIGALGVDGADGLHVEVSP